MKALLEAMKAYRAAGLCPIPVRGKRPMLDAWTSFKEIPGEEEIDSWATLRTREGESMDGVGLVTGRISGGLICLDLDCKNDPTNTMVKEFLDLLKSMEATAVVDICVGQKTPSGGFHMIFRCPEVEEGNQVFAKSDETKKAVIETRGQGGQFVAFPSPGYAVFKGNLTNVPRLTLRDTEILFTAARAVDRFPAFRHVEKKPPPTFKTSGEISPIDDYNAKATVDTVEAELEAVGWQRLFQRGPNIHFRRPDKKERSGSATLHVERMTFYVFTTSSNLQANEGYSPAAVLCYLHHNGDWSETARQLRKAGFGSPRPKPAVPSQPTTAPAPGPSHAASDEAGLIVSSDQLLSELVDLYRRPFDPGVSLGWPQFDNILRLKKPRLNLLTGIPGSGKSTWLNQVFITLAEKANWRSAIFSPESASPAEHLSDLVELICRKPFYGEKRPKESEAVAAAKIILDKITFLRQPRTGASFDQVLAAFEVLKPDATLIDPWNRLMHDRPPAQSETEYIGACLAKAASFATALNLSFWIVAHPQKIQRDKDGNLRRPGLYDVAGSAHWINMIDVGILVWRNYERGSNEVEVIKVRHKRDGQPGLVEMKFDRETGHFREWTNVDEFSLPIPPLPDQRSDARRALENSVPTHDKD